MKKFVLVIPSVEDNFLKINKDYLKYLESFNILYFISSYDLKILDNLNLFSGIILSGGGDFGQEVLNERLHPLANNIYPERDKFEISLIKKAYKSKIPTLGICRGAQAISLALGGKIHQHIENHNQNQKSNIPTHLVYIEETSKLFNILNSKKINVNSFHHQVIKDIPEDFKCCAISDDGQIEAIENKKDFFFLGLQWHPEKMNYLESYKIFNEFAKSVLKQ